MLEGINLDVNDIVLLEASTSELLIIDGYLPIKNLYNRYNKLATNNNHGVVVNFTGFVRHDEGIKQGDGLFFEVYEPMLVQWFSAHKERLESEGILICMAHSRGFVPVTKSSFIVCLSAKHRESLFNELLTFVEDFKQNAPIWKYDYINGKKIFERLRSKPLRGSGLFGDFAKKEE